jgi:hypothetical protein
VHKLSQKKNNKAMDTQQVLELLLARMETAQVKADGKNGGQ